jgi:hypothetical protein
VLTGQYDNHRDSYNNNEIHLNSNTVCATTCGVTQILTDGDGHTLLTVDSNDLPMVGSGSGHTAVANPIYSQPLYVAGMSVSSPASASNCNTITSTTCNMVVTTTLNGTMFAWNADNGSGLWARYGSCGSSSSCDQSGLPPKVGNAFWQDDCGGITGATSPGVGVTVGGPLQFLGNVSTGVIDTAYVPSSTTAVMYVTSYCQYTNSSSNPAAAWFLHEVDLKTGLDVSSVQVNPTASCANYNSNGDGGCFSGQITFDKYGSQNQRPALLEVSSSSVSPNHVIYVPFGALANPPSGTDGPYHGWMVAYTTNSGGVISSPEIQFNTSTYGPASGNTGAPLCQSTETWPGDGSSMFGYAANHCGFWASFWQSGRGAAATNYGDLDDSAIDIFAGTGDGTFQANGFNSGGLMRFQLTSSGVAQNPYQWFATSGDQQWQPSSSSPHYGTQICGPSVSGITQSGYAYSPCNPPIQPPQVNSACSGSSSVGVFCEHTFEVENNNDWDPSIAGETLFYNGIDGRWEIVTINKDGIVYILNPGDFCNGGSGCISSTGYAFVQHDPGVLFSFIAPEVPCWMHVNGSGQVVPNSPGPQVPDCDHANSMAFFNYLDSSSGDTYYRLYYWPNDQQNGGNERLTALQMDQLATPWNTYAVGSMGSSPTQSTNSDGTTNLQAGSGATTAFTQQVIPGDQIVCGCTTPSCPVVTQVISDTQITLSQALPGSCNISTSTIYYAGHFINPRVDQYPNPNTTGYPGGSLVVAGCQTTSASAPTCESSGTLVNSDTAIVWAISTADSNSDGTESGGTIRTQGWLHAYQAKPISTPSLKQLWVNTATDCGAACQTWCASSFALPTVANGKVFVPTYAINLSTTENGPPCPDVDYSGNSFQSGIWVAGIAP